MRDEATQGRPAVYFLFCGEECVYVGQSGDVRTRVRAHQFPFDRVFYWPVAESQRLRAEKKWIRRIKPVHNKQHVTAPIKRLEIDEDRWKEWAEQANRLGMSMDAYLRVAVRQYWHACNGRTRLLTTKPLPKQRKPWPNSQAGENINIAGREGSIIDASEPPATTHTATPSGTPPERP